MKTALIQLNIAWESKKQNHEKARAFIEKASKDGCDLVVFPEMFNTGCSLNTEITTEVENGETDRLLSSMSKKFSINMIAGYAIKYSDRQAVRNTAAVFDRKGRLVSRFTKLHSFPLNKEDRFYHAGDSVACFMVDGIASSLFICYDLRFPEDFRNVAKQVEAIFVIANWPSIRKDHWETLLKARAIENQCFVIGVNRTGRDGLGLEYSGASHVFDPMGYDLCCGKANEEYLLAEFDPSEVGRTRSKYPFLKDI